MSDAPKQPFRDATNPATSEKSIRDKDNAAPEHKPRGVELSRDNLAPRGMSGIKSNPRQSHIRPTKILTIDIREGDPEPHLFIDGNIGTMDGYSFIAKVHDAPQKHGINGGQIEKLDIRQAGVSVARYDRGWDFKPQTARETEAVRIVEDKFNGKTREFKPIASKSPDKDYGHER